MAPSDISNERVLAIVVVSGLLTLDAALLLLFATCGGPNGASFALLFLVILGAGVVALFALVGPFLRRSSDRPNPEPISVIVTRAIRRLPGRERPIDRRWAERMRLALAFYVVVAFGMPVAAALGRIGQGPGVWQRLLMAFLAPLAPAALLVSMSLIRLRPERWIDTATGLGAALLLRHWGIVGTTFGNADSRGVAVRVVLLAACGAAIVTCAMRARGRPGRHNAGWIAAATAGFAVWNWLVGAIVEHAS